MNQRALNVDDMEWPIPVGATHYATGYHGDQPMVFRKVLDFIGVEPALCRLIRRVTLWRLTPRHLLLEAVWFRDAYRGDRQADKSRLDHSVVAKDCRRQAMMAVFHAHCACGIGDLEHLPD
jgi:hypothetical protein